MKGKRENLDNLKFIKIENKFGGGQVGDRKPADDSGFLDEEAAWSRRKICAIGHDDTACGQSSIIA